MKEAIERQRKSLKKRQSGKLLFLQISKLEIIYWLFGLSHCLRQVNFSILSLDLWCGTVCVYLLGEVGCLFETLKSSSLFDHIFLGNYFMFVSAQIQHVCLSFSSCVRCFIHNLLDVCLRC